MVVPQLGGSGTRRRMIRNVSTTAAVLVTVLALAGCSSGKASTTADTSDSGTTTSKQSSSGGEEVSIVMIGGSTSDPFFSSVRRGATDAAKAYGKKLDLTFLGPKDYSNLGPDVAKLEETALSQKPSVILSPDWVRSSQDPAFKSITKSGTPLFIYNSGGSDAAKAVGAVTYIGSDDYLAGKAGGDAFAQAGVKHVLCVNTVPGASNQEARCKGIKDGAEAGGSKETQLNLPSANFGNPSAVTQAVKAALLKDTSIDGVVALAVADTDSAAAAITAAGKEDSIQLATFDVSNSQLTRIKDGKQLFAIDQQPYLQGFLAVSAAYQYSAYGLLQPANPNLTGPLLITKDNVDKAISGTKLGVR